MSRVLHVLRVLIFAGALLSLLQPREARHFTGIRLVSASAGALQGNRFNSNPVDAAGALKVAFTAICLALL